MHLVHVQPSSLQIKEHIKLIMSHYEAKYLT